MQTAIDCQQLSKVFGQGQHAVKALDNVSLGIGKGEFFTLLGPSGCGKTTLLRLIAGFESPTEGRITLDGQDITNLAPNHRPINTVFQSYALFPHLTVAENVAFGLKMLGRAAAEARERAQAMLDLVRLGEFSGRRVSQLSGGQQQRVALARALAPAPKVLLLDEPLSALDLKLRKEMQIELKRLQHETGITFVFVTHDQEEALTMSDRIAVMSAGRVQQLGTPREIYTRPGNRFVAGFIGESNFIPAQITAGYAELPGGGRIAVDPGVPDGPATLAVRPESLALSAAGASVPGAMPATVTNAVYFGTDSHLYARLQDGTRIVLRLPASAKLPDEGAAITIGVAPGAAQVLAAE
ncbi:ABC transporter ATP-binding protein [Paracoccus pacificus]|uniref:Spermidine/putrescine import ATP-binding protein PotA n=1 Tax=Paracoccus pacificus TaxID=1463598 RepID=A0ABW4R6B3_9RHOB